MRDLDAMIDEALAAEERDLLRAIGEEPGYLAQATSMFGGRTGWVNVVVMVTQTIAFIIAVWAAVRFFAATDVLDALHWGLPAATLMVMALVLKTSLRPVMEANRVIREVKRLELQLARMGRRDEGDAM